MKTLHIPNPGDVSIELGLILGRLGPNATQILLAVARRLDVGRAHGDFTDRRDWDKESSEELLDFVVYQTAKMMGLGGP